MPGTTAPRNGLPPVAGYVYRGTGRDTLTPPHVMAAWRRRDPETAADRARNPRPQDRRLATDRVLDAIGAAGGQATAAEIRRRLAADGGPELSTEQVFGALYELAGRDPAAVSSTGRRDQRLWKLGPAAPATGSPPAGPPAATAREPADVSRPGRLTELEAQLAASGVIAPPVPPEPSPPPAVKRCKKCGYMQTAPGHLLACGGPS
jgi:hypothetical protein